MLTTDTFLAFTSKKFYFSVSSYTPFLYQNYVACFSRLKHISSTLFLYQIMLNTEKDEQTFYFEMQKIYQNSM